MIDNVFTLDELKKYIEEFWKSERDIGLPDIFSFVEIAHYIGTRNISFDDFVEKCL
jgi:hypothetical protein